MSRGDDYALTTYRIRRTIGGMRNKKSKVKASGERRSFAFTPEDEKRLAFMLAHEQPRAVTTLNNTDMVRLALREAAKKRGYEDAATKGGAK
jgi:hypothetical protein